MILNPTTTVPATTPLAITIPTPGGEPEQVIADLVAILGTGEAIQTLASAVSVKLSSADSVSVDEFEALEQQLQALQDWAVSRRSS